MPSIKTPTRTVTGPQLKSGPGVILTSGTKAGVAELPQDGMGTLTPQKIRAMRKDPTIALVRQLLVAPALLAPWSYEEKENAPKDAAKFIEEQIEPLRSYMIRQTLLGCVDFGWAPFEEIFAKDGERIGIAKMKPLLQDWTDIMVDPDTGAFLGFRQQKNAAYVYVPAAQSFLHAFDVEGTYWYGQSMMANAEIGYDNWNNVDEAAVRYDKKIAGSHWVVHYPVGTSTYNGVETDNETIARDILASLQSSGGIAVPKSLENFIKDLDSETPNAWEIELISDKGTTSATFTDRQKYYDSLKVRAFGFPERSILEGQFGTKSEAEAHADFAITAVLLRTEDLIRDLNWHVINQLLRINWGQDKENTVQILGGSLGKENRAFLQELYIKLIDKPAGFVAEFDNIDRNGMRDVLDIPTDEEMEGAEDAIRDQIGRGDSLRVEQRGEVGGPQQQWGGPGDNGEGELGVGAGRRPNRQPDEGRAVRDTVVDDGGDDPDDDN